MGNSRFVKPEDIPNTLWDVNQKALFLPPDLIAAWAHILNSQGLYAQALQPSPESVIGGLDQEATNQHLIWRFGGSSARVQLAILDPKDELSEVADAFAKIFSGVTVLLTDIPCGSGAAAITILATIAELRRQERIPRQPLTVKLIGGEISEFARTYADQGIKHIVQKLNEQAIWIETEFLHWDALDKFSTTNLIKSLTLAGEKCGARALILANFSGFLSSSGNWKAAAPQFERLFLHNHDPQSIAIWIEPQTNKALSSDSGLFSKLTKWFKKNFLQENEISKEKEDAPASTSEASALHPLRKDHVFRVNLAVLRFNLQKMGDEN